MALCLLIIPEQAWEIIWDTRNQTWIVPVQDKYHTYCVISSAPGYILKRIQFFFEDSATSQRLQRHVPFALPKDGHCGKDCDQEIS